MGNIQTQYGSHAAMSITLNALGSNAAREASFVQNTSGALDAHVFLTVASGTSAVSATGVVNVYAYASINDGGNYTGGATGTDAAITLTSPPAPPLIGVLPVLATSVVYNGGPYSVASAFGGALPERWGVVVQNQSGFALRTNTSNAVVYQEISGLTS